MNMIYLYIKTKHEVPYKNIDLIFKSIIGGDFTLEWYNNFGKIILMNRDIQIIRLNQCFDAINSDLQDELTMVIVPIFDKEIENIVKANKRTGLYYFVEELNKLLVNDFSLKDKLLSFEEELNEDILQTVKIYIEQNMSINQVSRIMFTHRNTINYRISRFIELTGIDIRLSSNGYYVYTLITW